jgi:peptidoglycan-associated lipoprotein
MNRSLFAAVVLLSSSWTWACGPKPPRTSATAAVEAPPAPVVAPPEAPAPVDEMPHGLPADLQELNAYLGANGLLADVYFAFDESMLDDTARDRLAKNAEFLGEHPEYLVTIEGHCDDRGTNDYNLALGERRASSAAAYLRGMGASIDRTISFGEERGVCDEVDESCRSRNRRAHFVVTGRR